MKSCVASKVQATVVLKLEKIICNLFVVQQIYVNKEMEKLGMRSITLTTEAGLAFTEIIGAAPITSFIYFVCNKNFTHSGQIT